MEIHETKMIADQEAYHQNLCGRSFSTNRGTCGRNCIGKWEDNGGGSGEHFHVRSRDFLDGGGTTAIDDGDSDLISASKPKRGDGLDVFIANLWNARSYVNTVRGNQQKKTEMRKDRTYFNGGRKLQKADDDGQRLDENIVEHEGIGVTNHDEVEDYDDSAGYDDQEVEQCRDDMDGGQDFKEYGAEHEDYDEEHCEQTATAGEKRVE